MFDAILESLAPGWREVVAVLTSLVAWIPAWQASLLDGSWAVGGPAYVRVIAWVFLLLPALLLIVATWTTMVSVYTLPFRARRSDFIRTLAFTWWDAGRGTALYWAGIARLAMVLVGYVWGVLRYAVVLTGRILKELVASPAAALDWTARRYFKPGVPWLAFVLIVAWSALEAAVFTFTLRPTMTEVLFDISGTAPNPALVTPILYALLFFLIAGSFACIQVLADAVENRRYKVIAQMLVIEFFVMFFEVMFLYRELIDAITPWIAQQTGEQFRLGLWSTLALACFGWVGIRGMTWFLFGRFGTPALLAVLSRETLSLDAAEPAPAGAAAVEWWREMLRDFKAERAWFQARANELLELLVLPVLQLLAAAINFCVVVVSSRPAFALPFRSLDEAMARVNAGADAADVEEVVAVKPKRNAGRALAGAAREA